jgi:hypothetical protein
MDASAANAIKSRTPLRASRALRSALRERGRSVGSITYFYSSKSGRDILFSTEPQFACGVLLEADERVKGYEVDTGLIAKHLDDIGYVGRMPHAVVTRWSERLLFLDIVRFQRGGDQGSLLRAEDRRRTADAVGADWDYFDARRFQDRSRLFHDWVHIAPVLAQTRVQLEIGWEYLSKQVLHACKKPISLAHLRSLNIESWDLVFAAAFKLVQVAALSTDLEVNPLSPATKLRTRGTANAK